MRQYVPVPHDALGLVTPDLYGAVTDLFRRAHMLRWRPFEVTTRSLATSWNVSTRKVWDVLCLLEAAGMVSLVRGDERRPTRITVYDPNSDDGPVEVKRIPERTMERTMERSKVLPTLVMGVPETHTGTHGETHGVTTLGEPEPEPEHENTPPAADAAREPQPLLLTPPPATKPTEPDDWDRVAAFYGKLPGKRKPSRGGKPDSNGQILARMIREIGADATELVLRWWTESPDSWAVQNRDWPLSTIANGKLEGRLEAAERWARQGYPKAPDPSTDTPAPRLTAIEQDRADAERFAADAERRAEARKARMAKLAASPPPLRRGEP